MQKTFTAISLSLFSSLALAQPKNDTGPGSDNNIVYIILGIMVVATGIYFFSTQKKKG